MNHTTSEPSLASLLQAEPYRFRFFQAVRVLSRVLPERDPVGGDDPPLKEAVWFRARPSLEFPASEIHALTSSDSPDIPWTMLVSFFGLTGPSGALPRYYTELILSRARQKDFTLRDFLDLFNHRLISLFFRAWEKHRFWIGYEKAELESRQHHAAGEAQVRDFVLEKRPQVDLFSDILLNLTGLGTPALRYRVSERDRLAPRTTIADETFRFYAGLLAQQHRSAVGLESILRDYFGVPAQVMQFFGQWLRLDPESQTSLTSGGNTELGVNAIAGERIWDAQGKFRVLLGPLSYPEFRGFLPSGKAHWPLAHLSRLYSGIEFDIDVQLVLKAAEVPWCQLNAASDVGARLGWDTWIRSEASHHDAGDATFALQGS